jgi:hypothetical protein
MLYVYDSFLCNPYLHFFPSSSESNEDNLSNPGTQEDTELIVGTWAQSLSQTRANNVATRQRELAPPTRTHIYPKFIMSDNKKQEKDFTPEVEALLPEAEKLAKVRLVRPSARSLPKVVLVCPCSSRESCRSLWIRSLLWRSSREMCVSSFHSPRI